MTMYSHIKEYALRDVIYRPLGPVKYLGGLVVRQILTLGFASYCRSCLTPLLSGGYTRLQA